MGSTRVASADNSGNIYYFHVDHLGSTNVLTDRWGGQREVTEYDPFGQIIRHDQGLNVPKVLTWNYFTGKKLDDESGLMYYGARYYNPKLGRFITPDTIVQAPSNPQTLNRYTYCNNNPVNLIDSTGHDWWSRAWSKLGGFFTKGPGSSILQIVGVVAAPFTGGASLMLTYIGMAISGYNAYRAGREQFNAWLEGTAIGLVVGGMVNSVLGASIASFYGGGLLGSTLAGATMGGISGAIAGGITAGVLGGNWAQGARTGGISGAAAGGAAGYSGAVARANTMSNNQKIDWSKIEADMEKNGVTWKDVMQAVEPDPNSQAFADAMGDTPGTVNDYAQSYLDAQQGDKINTFRMQESMRLPANEVQSYKIYMDMTTNQIDTIVPVKQDYGVLSNGNRIQPVGVVRVCGGGDFGCDHVIPSIQDRR
ncbi:MAG: hypothetical protein HQL22_00010 [Candidatus Omnitrophica bacterium]|nr:hypothetical protein [Candidatus Omnitrophota bacterium]